MRWIKLGSIGAILLLVMPVYKSIAQDVSFSQFFSNPVWLNPAFAGSLEVPRLTVHSRNQWYGFGSPYKSYSLGVDLAVSELRGGLGFFLMNDVQGEGFFQTLQMQAAWSVFVPVSDRYQLQGALQGGIGRHALQPGKLVFPDNLDPVYGQHGISGEFAGFGDTDFIYADLSAGILLFSPTVYGGVALHHINEPRFSFSGRGEGEQLPRKFTAHFGARLPVYLYGHQRKKFDISPQLLIQSQHRYLQLSYGMLLSMKGLEAGMWFRQNNRLRYDALILMVGFARNRWQIAYSYDITVSGLWGSAGGTSEISLSFLLKPMERGRHLPFYHVYEE